MRLPLTLAALVLAVLPASASAARAKASTVRLGVVLEQRGRGLHVKTDVSWRLHLRRLELRPAADTLASWCRDDPRRLTPSAAVKLLTARRHATEDFACARDRLLRATGAFVEHDGARYALQDAPPVFRLEVGDGDALMRVTADAWLLGDDRQYIGPFLFETSDEDGATDRAFGPGTVRVLVRRRGVPRGTRRIIRVETPDMDRVSAEPAPTTVSGPIREWVVERSAARGQVRVRAELGLAGRLAIALEDETWGRLLRRVTPWLFELLFTLLVAIAAKGAGLPRTLAWALFGVVTVVVARDVFEVYEFGTRFPPGASYDEVSRRVSLAGSLAIAVAIAAACLCALAAALARRERTLPKPAWAAAAAGAIVIAAVVGTVWWRVTREGSGSPSTSAAWLGVVLRTMTVGVFAVLLTRVALVGSGRKTGTALRTAGCVALGVAVITLYQELDSHRDFSGELLFYVFGGGSIGDAVEAIGAGYWQAAIVMAHVGSLVPVACLGCAWGALAAFAGRENAGLTLLDEARALLLVAVAFAAFVVGPSGERIGTAIPAGFLLALLTFVLARRLAPTGPVTRRYTFFRFVLLIAMLVGACVLVGVGQDVGVALAAGVFLGVLLIVPQRFTLQRTRAEALNAVDAGRAGLAARALDERRLARRRRDLDNGWCEGSIDVDERTKVAKELEADPPAAAPSTPGGVDAVELALAHGPAGTWRGNGVEAVRYGLLLAVVPVGYYAYVVVVEGVAGPDGPHITTAYAVTLGLIFELLFWMVSAFSFGALLSVLPTVAGVTKALVLTGIYLGLEALGVLVAPVEDQVGLAFRTFELLLFLSALGAILDRRALGDPGWRALALVYRIREVGPAVAYVAPLIASVLVIAQQILSGNAQDAIRETIDRAPSVLPSGGNR